METISDYVAFMTQKAVETLTTAYRRLPEDKRLWTPGEDSRSAADMVAECALMNDISEIVRTRTAPPFDYATIQKAKAELVQDDARMLALLHEAAERGIAALRTVPASDLGVEVDLGFATFTLGEIISYPFWNMSYHEGQINYIASLL